MTRRTVCIFDKFPHAWDLDKVLREAGIDSKIVTKHAVQIHPDHFEQALNVCRAEKARRDAEELEKATK